MTPVKSMRHGATACVIALLTLPAVAQVTVTDPWVRATVQGQTATGAFMKLQSAKDARLVEARSPVAGVVEIHEMAMDNNVMRMRAVQSLELAAGRVVEMKPGGYHVMLMDLKQQVKEGETVPVTLVLETAGKRELIEVKAAARTAAARNDMMKKHGH
jgi:copper(I)-binding protein